MNNNSNHCRQRPTYNMNTDGSAAENEVPPPYSSHQSSSTSEEETPDNNLLGQPAYQKILHSDLNSQKSKPSKRATLAARWTVYSGSNSSYINFKSMFLG